MATDSIFHMIRLTDPQEIARFIETLEAAEQWALEHEGEEINAPPCREITNEDIDRIFGDS